MARRIPTSAAKVSPSHDPAASGDPHRTALPKHDLEQLVALYNQKQFVEVVRRSEELVSRHASSIMLHNIAGAAFLGLNDFIRAEDSFRDALAIEEGHAELHNNLGTALEFQRKLDEAVASYRRALALRPDHASAHFNLGNVLRKQHAMPAAMKCYEQALALKPDYAEACNNLGLTLQHLGEPEAAVKHYGRALSLKPDFAEALYNLATALIELKDFDSAIRAFDLVISLRPDHFAASQQKSFAQMQVCDFSAARDFPPPRDDTSPEPMSVPPFIMLAFSDDPERQLRYSREWSKTSFAPQRTGQARTNNLPSPRIRIGYFSADFHDHATLHLMAGLFREHDRQRFEVIAYSYGPDSSDAARNELIGNVDRFVDISPLSDHDVVGLVHDDGLDIAVDLKGYTKDSRSRLFTNRLAPIQMNYLGYPGSMGADCMDYLIADPVVVPESMRAFYSEKIIYLPGSYQPNDDERRIASGNGNRRDFGLPDDGLVFCCFNQNYKIGATEFDIWMKILREVDGSVLWLLRQNAIAETNLRREAALRGVDPDRLIFAEPMPHAAHLGRLQLADLFLDTFNYNAHTTASDALWAGVPVVTKAGRQFAARVGASLLHAIGLPDLVVETPEDYQDLACSLAAGPSRLASVRERLTQNRLSQPLFDTRLYTRKIESAYSTAHQRHLQGLAPSDIVVR